MDAKSYALLGYPVAHSVSPAIHQALFDAQGVGGTYELRGIEPSKLATFMRGEARTLDGFNLTIPHKAAAADLLDALSETARLCGAVNTVAVEAGRLVGHNTDCGGFARALAAEGFAWDGKTVLLLGAGGAAAAVCHALKPKAHVRVWARDAAKQAAFCARQGVRAFDGRYDSVQAVVNATPVGMYPQEGERPVDLSLLPSVRWVFDMVYNPPRSALLAQADSLGIPAASGLGMLVWQAAEAHMLWYGARFTDAQIARALRAAERALFVKRLSEAHGKQNIALCGFMAAGKTSIAGRLSARCGFAPVDTDALIERRTGLTVAALFDERGQDFFRALEDEIAGEIAHMARTCLSLGGGFVLDEKRAAQVRRSSLLVFVDTPLETILERLASQVGARPLLAGEGEVRPRAAALYAARRAIYERAAALRFVPPCGDAEANAAALMRRV